MRAVFIELLRNLSQDVLRPASVEVHTCLSVFRDQILHVEVAPDKQTEVKWPPPLRLVRFQGDRSVTTVTWDLQPITTIFQGVSPS